MKKNIFVINVFYYLAFVFMPFCSSFDDMNIFPSREGVQGYVAIKLADSSWGNLESNIDNIWHDAKLQADAVKNAYKMQTTIFNGFDTLAPKKEEVHTLHYVAVGEKPTIPDAYSEKDVTALQKGWFSSTEIKFTTKFFDTKKDLDSFFQKIITDKKQPAKEAANMHTLNDLLHSFIKDINALYIKISLK
jgi:hypothetical protein